MKYDEGIEILKDIDKGDFSKLKRISVRCVKLNFDIEKAKNEIEEDDIDIEFLDQPFGSLDLIQKTSKKFLEFGREKSNSLGSITDEEQKKKDELLDILRVSGNLHVMSSKKLGNTNKVMTDFEEIVKIEKKYGLIDVLTDPFKRKYFKMFCAKEFSMENVLFWEIATKYKETTDLKKRIALAEEIFNSFLNEDSSLTINTSKFLINNTEINYKKQRKQGLCEPTLFEEIRKDVQFGVMKDTYFRFDKGPLYQEMLNAKPRKEGMFESHQSESDIVESLIDETSFQ